MGGFSSVTNDETIMFADNASFDGTKRGGAISTDGQLWIGSSALPHVRPGTPTINANGNLDLGNGSLQFNPYNTAKWIVDPLNNIGTHTTIGGALAAAVSGETIFIRPGVYTENITLKDGVNLTAFASDGVGSSQGGGGAVTKNVVILGTTTASYSGLVTLSGIQFKTNGAAAINVTGTGNLILNSCSVYASDATGITSNSAMNLNFYVCTFKADTGYAIIVNTQAPCAFLWCILSGDPATPNTTATSNMAFDACNIQGTAFSTSSTGTITVICCNWGCGGQTALTTSGTGTSSIYNTFLNTTTATSLSAGSGTTIELYNSEITTSNVTAIAGAGTLKYGCLLFVNTGSSITTTTQTPVVLTPDQGGKMPWTTVTGTTQTAVAGNGYIANNAGTVTVTLPATSAVGDTVSVTGINNATGWLIAQNAGNTIYFGASTTTPGVGGSLASAATRDAVTLVCMTANAVWQCVSSIGNITVV